MWYNWFMPLVSVIIPTYNRSGFVKEVISSVLSQTYWLRVVLKEVR